MEAVKSFFTALFYQPLLNALVFLAWLIPGHSIGWAIIVLTILIRLILLPSSLKVLEQQRRIKALQPKLDELKSKHGDDKTAHSKAMMELYAAERVNPLGGCLPTLIQFPILIGLYQVFIHGLSLDQFHLLYPFTPHLSSLNMDFYGLDLSKPEPWVLPIVSGLLQYLQTRLMMPTSMPSTGSKEGDDVSKLMSRQMTILLPIITIFAVRSVPAAVGLYWLSTILFSIVQQIWFNRLAASPVAVKAKPTDVMVTVKKKSSKD